MAKLRPRKTAFHRVLSNYRRVLPLIISNSLKAFLRGDKTALREWILPLRLKHFLRRWREPRHRSVFGKMLLLLDPVQYELTPRLRFRTATTLRQKLTHVLVRECLGLESLHALRQLEDKAAENDAAVDEIWNNSIRSWEEGGKC
jgi:hypothetical protein